VNDKDVVIHNGLLRVASGTFVYMGRDSDGAETPGLAKKAPDIREPRTTTGGMNFVIGFQPELWRSIVPADAPPGVEGFNNEIHGTEGFVMPSTQHDALVWLSGSAYDVIFDMARSVVRDLRAQASPILLASLMARRIRRCSTLPSRRSCPKEFPVLPAQSCCFKSGSTR
jgi:hypothetical protein